MNGALSLMPVSEETDTISLASTLTLPFTVGDLLFLAGAGNGLRIRRAKIGPSSSPCPDSRTRAVSPMSGSLIS